MFVRCSACTTRYRIDPSALGYAGRKLRCTRCGHVWLELPAAADPQEPESLAPSVSPAPSHRRSGGVGWLAAGLIVAAVLAGLALGRNMIVDTWPGTVQHYDAVGLTIRVPHADGLRIAGIESERVQQGESTVLLVRGTVENSIGHSRTVPALQAVLADEAGAELHRWRVAAVSSVLENGQSTTFESWLASPPEGAARVSVDFVADGGE